jgi:hypothetical protein
VWPAQVRLAAAPIAGSARAPANAAQCATKGQLMIGADQKQINKTQG